VASLGALTTAVFNRAFLAHLAQAGMPAGPAAHHGAGRFIRGRGRLGGRRPAGA